MSKGICKNLRCSGNQFRLGLCSRHYWELKGGRPARQRPLTKRENDAINVDDFWEWVKIELKIEDNKSVTSVETAHKP